MKIGENGETDTKLMNGTTDYCKDVPNYYMIILIKISAGFFEQLSKFILIQEWKNKDF